MHASSSKMTVSTPFLVLIDPHLLKIHLQAAPFASVRPRSPSPPPPTHPMHARYSEQWRRHRRACRGHHRMQYRSAPAGVQSDTSVCHCHLAIVPSTSSSRPDSGSIVRVLLLACTHYVVWGHAEVGGASAVDCQWDNWVQYGSDSQPLPGNFSPSFRAPAPPPAGRPPNRCAAMGHYCSTALLARSTPRQ